MKHAKIMPWGMVSPLGLRAGVQRKTKVYMEASKRDCMAPSRAILVSAGGVGGDGYGRGYNLHIIRGKYVCPQAGLTRQCMNREFGAQAHPERGEGTESRECKCQKNDSTKTLSIRGAGQAGGYTRQLLTVIRARGYTCLP